MTFAQPFWLLLAVPLLFILRAWPGSSRRVTFFRAASYFLLLLAMMQPSLYFKKKEGRVILLLDQSKSMPVDDSALEVVSLLQESRPKGAKLGIVTFGRDVALEKFPDSSDFSGFVQNPNNEGSNLFQGLQRALELIPPNESGRILLLSDGLWTGSDPIDAAWEAASRGVGIDYRHQSLDRSGDLAIASVDSPETVGPDQGFMIHAWIEASVEEEIFYQLFRGGKLISSGKRLIKSGGNRLVFRDLAGESGVLGYRLTVSSATGRLDPLPQNNEARFLVGVKGPKPLLLVSPSASSSLAQLLKRGGVAVQVKTPDMINWSLDELAGFSGVIIENTRAQDIGYFGMTNLAFWVEDSGAGLMMTGGLNSFGTGGYYRSPLEPILPVTMELRQEHRKLSLAMVIALDRSGSMGAVVSSGQTKMDLANLASAQALDLLGSQDEFGHLAVDSIAHEIVPLQTLENAAQIRNLILRVESGGGGIFVFEALSKAAGMLMDSKSGSRHIILFADAADAEEPGKYRELLEKCQASGISVSVVGLGASSDPDAQLLSEIAALGGGSIYFTNLPNDLPRIFAQDTFVVSRSTFIEEGVSTRLTPEMLTLAPQPLKSSPDIGGYNLCYLREGASMGMVGKDDYQAPILAFHHVGSGRALGFMGEAGGQFSGDFAKWEEVGSFFSSLARWTSGSVSSLPGQSMAVQSLEDGVLKITLHLDPEREADPFTAVPFISLLKGVAGKTPERSTVNLKWETADSLSAGIPLAGLETVLPTLQFPEQGSWSLSPSRLPYSPEYEPASPDKGETAMAELARITGGRAETRISRVWDSLPKAANMQSLVTPLLLLSIFMILLEVLERRTSFFTLLARKKAVVKNPVEVGEPAPIHMDPIKAQAMEPTEMNEAKPQSSTGLSDAMNKARDRAGAHTKR